jgi:preprotein translocase subunit SecY
MMKTGARIPDIKPGRQTIEYLRKIQSSTRFWGGLLLALLATVSTVVDYRFRAVHQGGSIGFTSMLIIVSSTKAKKIMPLQEFNLSMISIYCLPL